jgi:hypothetical protein
LELQVVSILTGGDGNQLDPNSVLKRTYAAFRRRRDGLPDVTASDATFLSDMRQKFIAESGAPEWLTVAAQRSGLDFFLTHGIASAWGRIRKVLSAEMKDWTVSQWLDEFLRVAAIVPPGLLQRQFPASRLVKVSEAFKKLLKEKPEILRVRDRAWTPPAEWTASWNLAQPPLQLWMSGASIAEIAAYLVGKPVGEIPSERTQAKPLPKALGVTGECWSSLALIAGGFLAVAEQIMNSNVPNALACLPMCIKYGFDSPGSLAWFRFGVRLRRPSRLLSMAFPVPLLATDEEARRWVRAQRRLWLNGEAEIANPDLLRFKEQLSALHAFITS